MTSHLLDAMVSASRRTAIERAKHGARATVERAALARGPRGLSMHDSLRAAGIRIIAECKRRSPSRGILRADYDAAAIARGYEAAGAAAISVLTEPTFFDGSLDDLSAVTAAVHLPVLRKDFIVTDFQIIEARAAGAAAVLLIVAALDDASLRALLETAASLNLAALVEVHDRPECERALAAGATIVGVNSRDLRTLEMDISVFERMAPLLPPAVIAVAESGLKSADDLTRLHALGYRAFLMGERFMSASEPGAALKELKALADSGEARR